MSLAAQLDRTLAGLDRLLDACGQPALRAPGVSAWSVGEHVEHLLKVDLGVAARLASSPLPREAPRRLRLVARVMLWTGWIPRGRVKAPAPFLPAGGDYVDLARRVHDCVRTLRELGPLLAELEHDRTRINHSVLGGMTRRQWLRFLEVHHDHHLAIIADIRAAVPEAEPAIAQRAAG